MGRNRLALLTASILLLPSILSTVQALDFSQFYLPPCCYIAPQGEPYSGYASAIVNTKHEAPTFREAEEETRNISLSTNKTETFPQDFTTRLYKLIVPIDNEVGSETTTHIPTREDSTQLQPPSVTVENILFSDLNISEPLKFKRNSNLDDTQEKNRQKVALLENEVPENSNSEKKSLSESENKLKTKGKSIFSNETVFTTVASSNSSQSNSSKLVLTEKFVDVIELSQEPLQEASSEVKAYSENTVTRKMPAIWLQNLRRALYQSLTAEKGDSNTRIESQSDAKQVNSLSKQFWRTLRKAKLKYVDKLSQSSSELPEAIYLPSGQGPIVSGVVVNSANGVELRLASELYVAPAEGEGARETREDCQCSLIHHGEIVMAYWSVSRIFNEHGHPALQYLVYPLPHTVPTPPEFHPFPGNDVFRPSPIDPIANLKGNYYQSENTPLHHDHQNHLGDLTNQQIPSPPYFHQLANGHHRLEISQSPEMHTQIPILPTGPNPSTITPLHPTHGHIKDYRGVLMENEHGYTPEFLEMYRAAISEHFRLKDAYNKGLHYNQPGPSGPTGSVGPNGIPLAHHHHQLPTDLPLHSHDPPVQENPIIGPTHPPPPPLSSIGPNRNPLPNYPNSIQDILAPIHPPSGPSALPPLDVDNFIHPAESPPVPINNPPQGNYPPVRTNDKYPTNVGYPDTVPKGNRNNNRPNTPQKNPNNNKDKYPYPSKYPPGGQGQVYPFPPNKYPSGGTGAEFRPPNFQDVQGSLPYQPPPNYPERPSVPYHDRDPYDSNKIYDDDLNNTNQRPAVPKGQGVGTAYNINDKLYYPDNRPKPYVKYNLSKPRETKKIKQEINDESYILNF